MSEKEIEYIIKKKPNLIPKLKDIMSENLKKKYIHILKSDEYGLFENKIKNWNQFLILESSNYQDKLKFWFLKIWAHREHYIENYKIIFKDLSYDNNTKVQFKIQNINVNSTNTTLNISLLINIKNGLESNNRINDKFIVTLKIHADGDIDVEIMEWIDKNIQYNPKTKTYEINSHPFNKKIIIELAKKYIEEEYEVEDDVSQEFMFLYKYTNDKVMLIDLLKKSLNEGDPYTIVEILHNEVPYGLHLKGYEYVNFFDTDVKDWMIENHSDLAFGFYDMLTEEELNRAIEKSPSIISEIKNKLTSEQKEKFKHLLKSDEYGLFENKNKMKK